MAKVVFVADNESHNIEFMDDGTYHTTFTRPRYPGDFTPDVSRYELRGDELWFQHNNFPWRESRSRHTQQYIDAILNYYIELEILGEE
jgi:hypothetical protein